MLEAAPVLVEVSTRWFGVALPSETMVAVTPTLALLMASRMPCRELLLASMTTLPLIWLAFWVKVAPR
ncbi:hypothetical protein LP420_29350 [Massilia sp. B-10]|nr:hypothetical protein LP420_29350 [Massilia sp. B-10]